METAMTKTRFTVVVLATVLHLYQLAVRGLNLLEIAGIRVI